MSDPTFTLDIGGTLVLYKINPSKSWKWGLVEFDGAGFPMACTRWFKTKQGADLGGRYLGLRYGTRFLLGEFL